MIFSQTHFAKVPNLAEREMTRLLSFCFYCVLGIKALFNSSPYAEDFTGSPATTERYMSRTCCADRSHEYFRTSS